MTHPVPSPWACLVCGAQLFYELCRDWNDTDHGWMTAMECRSCGDRFQSTCPHCARVEVEQ